MARRMHPMESGERDRETVVEQLTDSVGASGFPVGTWTTLFRSYWCRRQDVSGREKFTASQLSTPYTTRWEGPFVPEMDPETVDVPKTRRLVYQGRTYDIIDASMIGLREGVELLTLATTRES